MNKKLETIANILTDMVLSKNHNKSLSLKEFESLSCDEFKKKYGNLSVSKIKKLYNVLK